jgi:protease PrsW
MLASELLPGAIVASAIAPALVLLWLVVAADSRPEPPRVVLIAVVLGVLSTIAALLLEWGLPLLIPISQPTSQNSWLGSVVSTLLFVAIPEETVKISMIAAIALRARNFEEPMDGVVYGTAVGLGFAAVENLGYVVEAGTQWEITAIVRAVSAVPCHGAWGAIAGAYIAMGRFSGVLGAHSHSHGHRRRLFLSAWLIPVVLHTLSDASLFSQQVLVALVVDIGSIVFAVRLAHRIARGQKAWVQTKRLPPAHWRRVWAEALLAIGLSFVALTLGIAGHSGVNIAGWMLLVVAVGISWKCGRYLREAAKQRHRSATAPSP